MGSLKRCTSTTIAVLVWVGQYRCVGERAPSSKLSAVVRLTGLKTGALVVLHNVSTEPSLPSSSSRAMSDPYVTVLSFQHENPANTTLLNAESNTAYAVSTTFDEKHVPTTIVSDDVDRRIAGWVWREKSLKTHTLTFKDKQSVVTSSWLHESIIPFKK